MHRLSRWRTRGRACAQIQERDGCRLSTRSQAREAARPHERLGELLCRGRQGRGAAIGVMPVKSTVSLNDMRERVGRAFVGADWIGGLSTVEWNCRARAD